RGDPRCSTSVAWFDYGGDGRLDLFVCDYCQWTPATNQVCLDSVGRKHLCGPTRYNGARSTLYHNNGNGSFTDVTQKAGLAENAHTALGVVVWDYDDDGWPDLVVARDMQANLLLRNNHDATVTD